MPWCYAIASAIGVSHLRSGTRSQDAKSTFILGDPSTNEQLLVCIVSDGAGSAEFGGEGASILCRTLSTCVRKSAVDGVLLPTEEELWPWIDLARDRIQIAAARRNRSPRDFAATLVMLIASNEAIVTAHIGDGAIVARDSDDNRWSILSAPHHGEYASTTFFVTDDPQPDLRFIRHSRVFNAFAAFSDGIENLVLNAADYEPSAAFFDPIVRPLETSRELGRDCVLSARLGEFLSSDRLNERTDDDKTLIIAVRK